MEFALTSLCSCPLRLPAEELLEHVGLGRLRGLLRLPAEKEAAETRLNELMDQWEQAAGQLE